MYDSFNRPISYLRVSVTDRCNLRCHYCMPAGGVDLMSHHDILSFEEIAEVVHYGARQGITKVRITGGEPLVRKNITALVEMLASIPGIHDLAMTTNGTLLEGMAEGLRAAGLSRINVSLDTLDPDRYTEITRGGDLQPVLRGIREAIRVGLLPVKVNCVIREHSCEPDAQAVAEWGQNAGVEVRYIHMMTLHQGSFSQVEGGDGGNCASCNRLRLTANGLLKPCLFHDSGFSIRELGIEQAFAEALKHKPSCGSFNRTGTFYNIGG